MTLWPEVEKVFGHGYEVWALSPTKFHRSRRHLLPFSAPVHFHRRVDVKDYVRFHL